MKPKTYILLILFFCLVESITISVLMRNYNSALNIYEKQKTEELSYVYSNVTQMYGLTAKLLYSEIINKPQITKILKKAINCDSTELEIIRKELYYNLSSTYNNLVEIDFRQFHFHLPNNRSLLRFHAPGIWGDDLTNFRSTVKFANENKEYVSSFEEGRIRNGFRYVFPIIDSGLHIGSVEFGLSHKAIANQIEKNMRGISDIIIKKKDVYKYIFRENLENYTNSQIHGLFFRENSIDSNNSNRFLNDEIPIAELNYFMKNDKETRQKIDSMYSFSTIFSKFDEFIVTFLPIYNFNSKPIAYLILYAKDSYVATSRKVLIFSIVTFSIIIILVFLFIINFIKIKWILQQNIDEIKERNDEINIINENLNHTTRTLELTVYELDMQYQKMNSIFNSSNDAILLLSDTFKIVDLNRNASIYFENQKKFFIGKSVIELISEKNRNKFFMIKKQLEASDFARIEMDNFTYNQDIKVVDIRASKFYFDNKNYYIVNIRDITLIKETENQISSSNMRLDFIIKHNLNVIFIINPQIRKFTFISSNVKEIIGFDSEEILGPISNLKLSVEDTNGRNQFSKYLEEVYEKKIVEKELTIINKDGEIIWIFLKMKLLLNHVNQYEVIGTFEDISKRKHAEENLIFLNQRMDFILSNSPAVIYTLQAKNNYKNTFTSKNVSKLLGYPNSLFQDDYNFWLSRIHEEDVSNAAQKIHEVTVKGSITHSYRMYDSENNIKWVQDEIMALYDPRTNEIKELIGSVLDITKIKENELLLSELNQTKDKFFAIISHDLKSPLTGIINLTSLLHDKIDFLTNEQVVEITGKLMKASENFNKLLADLLLWSSLSRDSINFSPQKTELIFLVNDVIQLLDSSLISKQVKIVLKVDNSIFVTVDYNMIHTVLRNLLGNAIKFSYEKGLIYIETRKINNNEIEISIKDSGIGIKKDNLSKILNIAEKYSTVGTKGELGTGLGLIIVKELLKKHESNLIIESEYGKGTIIKFALPLHFESIE